MIDLRSDTVTKPTLEMRHSMFEASVGDDVYGEDPTVNKLEEMGARLLGKEAGIFVTSGTQGNVLAVMSQTRPGDEVIVDEDSHLFNSETGALSFIAGVQGKTIKGTNGVMDINDIKNAIRDDDIHHPTTSLLSLENSHGQSGGSVLPMDYMKKVYDLAQQHHMAVHLDGSRIFNAAISLKVTADVIVQYADTVQFCLSKGLSAPMGSLLVGPRDVINKARKWRKALGGGMRQAGVVAAAGIVALEEMRDRLLDDHQHAQKLASGLAQHGCFDIDVSDVETNIVIASTKKLGIGADAFIAKLQEHGIKASSVNPDTVRFVTHREITTSCVEQTIAVVNEIVKNMEQEIREHL